MTSSPFTWPEHILTLSTAPSALLTTAEAKAHLRVDHNDDDTYIDGLVSAAAAVLDGPNGMVGKALATQQWTLTRAPLYGAEILWLPVVPFGSVVSIAYYDADNVQQTLATDEAIAAVFSTAGSEDWGQVSPVTAWPAMYARADALTIVFSAGYGNPADVPANLLHAAKMLIGHWYENRETVVVGTIASELPMAVRALVDIHRIGWAGA